MLIIAVLLAEVAKKRGHKLNGKCQFDWKKWNITKHKTLLTHIKMGKEILTFGDNEINVLFFRRCRY